MKPVVASLSVLLAACTAPQSPPAAPARVEASAPAETQGAPMAKRAPGQESGDPLQVFRAFGTEPFWNVSVEGGTLTYTTPEDQAGVAMQGERHSLTGGVEIAGSHEGKAFTLTVSEGMCSDGMSDNQYRLIALFHFDDIDYRGCAEAAK